jgi:hypothetical protein
MENYLTIKQVASLSGKSDDTVWRWLKPLRLQKESEWESLPPQEKNLLPQESFLEEFGIAKRRQNPENPLSPFQWIISKELVMRELVSEERKKELEEIERKQEEALQEYLKEMIQQQEELRQQEEESEEELRQQEKEMPPQEEIPLPQDLNHVNEYIDFLKDQIHKKDKMLDDLMKQNSQLNTIVFQLNSGESAEKKMKREAETIKEDERF